MEPIHAEIALILYITLRLQLSSLKQSYVFPCSFPHSLPGSEQFQLHPTLMTSPLLAPATPIPWGALALQTSITYEFVAGRAILSQVRAKKNPAYFVM